MTDEVKNAQAEELNSTTANSEADTKAQAEVKEETVGDVLHPKRQSLRRRRYLYPHSSKLKRNTRRCLKR